MVFQNSIEIQFKHTYIHVLVIRKIYHSNTINSKALTILPFCLFYQIQKLILSIDIAWMKNAIPSRGIYYIEFNVARLFVQKSWSIAYLFHSFSCFFFPSSCIDKNMSRIDGINTTLNVKLTVNILRSSLLPLSCSLYVLYKHCGKNSVLLKSEQI